VDTLLARGEKGDIDEADRVVPQAQVQCAERLPWVSQMDEMPVFERFPGS